MYWLSPRIERGPPYLASLALPLSYEGCVGGGVLLTDIHLVNVKTTVTPIYCQCNAHLLSKYQLIIHSSRVSGTALLAQWQIKK